MLLFRQDSSAYTASFPLSESEEQNAEKMENSWCLMDRFAAFSVKTLLFLQSTLALKRSFIHIHCKAKDMTQNPQNFSKSSASVGTRLQKWIRQIKCIFWSCKVLLPVLDSHCSPCFLILFEFWISFIFDTEASSRHDPCGHLDPSPSLRGA